MTIDVTGCLTPSVASLKYKCNCCLADVFSRLALFPSIILLYNATMAMTTRSVNIKEDPDSPMPMTQPFAMVELFLRCTQRLEEYLDV